VSSEGKVMSKFSFRKKGGIHPEGIFKNKNNQSKTETAAEEIEVIEFRVRLYTL
jgi:hypothetical protein